LANGTGRARRNSIITKLKQIRATFPTNKTSMNTKSLLGKNTPLL